MGTQLNLDFSTYEYLQLAQSRPSDTSASSIVNPTGNERIVVTSIVIANTTASAATFSVFHDENGTTYDENTALVFGYNLPANGVYELEIPIPVVGSTNNLAVQQGTSSACTFTAYGFKKVR